MKRKTLFMGAVMAALLTLNGVAAGTLSASKTTEIKRALSAVPAPEIAAKASSIVAAAPSAQREEIAIEVVRLVAATKVAVLPAVVGAISKVSPEISPVVAGVAASLSNEQAEAIAKAAASAAPDHASMIAASVAKAAPKTAVQIARSVATISPEATGEIVDSVTISVPASKLALQEDQVLTRSSRSSATASLAGQGIITSFRGTIRGRKIEQAPERIASGRITFDYDTDRNDYARPR